MSEHDVDRTVKELRDEIAAVDLAILADVNARIELVARIRRYKADAGLPFVDRDRERELIEALDLQNAGPLSDDGLRELYTYLLDLTKREVGGDGAALEGRRHRRGHPLLEGGDLALVLERATDCVESFEEARADEGIDLERDRCGRRDRRSSASRGRP